MMSKSLSKVCFVGSARYSHPLGPTEEKKFKSLSSLGELFVIGFSTDLVPRRLTQHAHFYLFPELPLSLLRYFELFGIVPFLVLWLIFRHKVQILVAQSPFEGVIASLAKNIAHWFGRKIVVVIESHGDFEESLFLQRKFILPGCYRFCMTYASHFSLRYADMLRAVSDSTREQLERWKPGIPVSQFVTWTDIETFQSAGQNRRQSFSHIFLYAGVLVPRKGVIHLINAFASLAAEFTEARLILIGKAENQGYAAEMKTAVEQLGLSQRIQFLPALPQQQLAQYMGDASVFVLPTYSEGLPRVVFEAMSAGLPVIASAVSGIPEVIQEGSTGFLLEPGDEEALSAKMRWMLKHPAQAQEMGRKAFLYASTTFSTTAYVEGYRKMFDAAQHILISESV